MNSALLDALDRLAIEYAGDRVADAARVAYDTIRAQATEIDATYDRATADAVAWLRKQYEIHRHDSRGEWCRVSGRIMRALERREHAGAAGERRE